MGATLETKSITKIYQTGDRTIKAVDNVSIALTAGEFVALVGPSGSGKTTMLAMLAGLLSPNMGRIIVDGQDISQMSEAQRTKFRREKIGFTFQDNNLVPYLNARENVELMLRLNDKLDRESKRCVEELLDRLGLADRSKSLPNQLSRGQ